MGGESPGVTQKTGKCPVDLLDRGTHHNLSGNAQQLHHRAVYMSHPAVADHEYRSVAGLDQRLEPAPLRLQHRMFRGQRLALALDGGEKLRVVERCLDLSRQDDGKLQVFVLVDPRLFSTQVERADNFTVQTERNDQRGHPLLVVGADALRPTERIHQDRLPGSNRLAGKTTIKGKSLFLLYEATPRRVV